MNETDVKRYEVSKEQLADDFEPPRIVGEVSKTWRDDRELEVERPLLCERFETMIEHNRTRGYGLESWQMSSVLTAPGVLTETIVAVFARARCASGPGRCHPERRGQAAPGGPREPDAA